MPTPSDGSRADLHSASRVILMMLFGAAILALLPTPGYGQVAHAFNNFLHAPACAVMAFVVGWLVLKWNSSRPLLTIIACWGFVLAVSLILEWMQGLTPTRVPSREDALANACGVTAGILMIAGFRLFSFGKGKLLAIVLGLALIVFGCYSPGQILVNYAVALWKFPQLASFEREAELEFWYPSFNATISRNQQHFADGKWSLRVDLYPGRYPGVSLAVPPRDWSSYDELLIDIYLERGIVSAGSETLKLVIKVFDWFHNHAWNDDRFHRRVELKRGWQTVAIPVASIKSAPRNREMPLDNIAAIQFFTVNLPSSCTLYIDNVRLARRANPMDRS